MLKVVLRHQGITLTALIGTILLTGYLYGAAPKSFFPQQDTGLDLWRHRGGAGYFHRRSRK